MRSVGACCGWDGGGRKPTLRRGLKALGPEVVQGIRFVCSDMWKPYLRVIVAEVSQALHVLDRFHITSHLNQAVDQVRRPESSRLRAAVSVTIISTLSLKNDLSARMV